jgi:hypothetical protein
MAFSLFPLFPPPITDYQLPITDYRLPITDHRSPSPPLFSAAASAAINSQAVLERG